MDIFRKKIEKVHYRDCLVTTGATQRTLRTKVYDELGLQTLIKAVYITRICLFVFGFLLSNNFCFKILVSLVIILPIQEQNPLKILFSRIA